MLCNGSKVCQPAGGFAELETTDAWRRLTLLEAEFSPSVELIWDYPLGETHT